MDIKLTNTGVIPLDDFREGQNFLSGLIFTAPVLCFSTRPAMSSYAPATYDLSQKLRSSWRGSL